MLMLEDGRYFKVDQIKQVMKSQKNFVRKISLVQILKNQLYHWFKRNWINLINLMKWNWIQINIIAKRKRGMLINHYSRIIDRVMQRHNVRSWRLKMRKIQNSLIVKNRKIHINKMKLLKKRKHYGRAQDIL